MRRLRLIISAALAAALAMIGLVAFTQPAAAVGVGVEERYPVPASGEWTVNGHGWGHGRGLSQWGAKGAAEQGRNHGQILDFYYPGTVAGSTGNPTVRVALTALTPTLTATFGVPAGHTMTVTDSNGKLLVSGQTGRFTVTRSAAGYLIAQRDRIDVNEGDATTGVKTTYTSTAKDLIFSTGDGVAVFPTQRATDGKWYRGTIRLNGTSAATAFDVVNSLDMENYLRGVVPRESPASWPLEALKAQAIAARTYTVTDLSPSAPFDICDTVQCHVYGGRANVVADGVDWKPVANEAASTDRAIAETAGQIRTFNGKAAFTQYSSSNGGYSTGNPSYPYLTARPDPWSGTGSGDTVTSWSDTLKVSTVASKCPNNGSLRTLVITDRDGRGDLGGRITGITLECTTGTVALTGGFAFDTRSVWWKPTAPPVPLTGFFLNDAWSSEANHVFQYGKDTDEVFVGDWNGDGTDTITVRRGNTFYVNNTLGGGNATTVFAYGKPGDTILVGDWDGDGTDTFAVRRGSTYLIKNSMSGGAADTVVAYGHVSDEILVGDWDGDGDDTLTVRRGNMYHVKNTISGGAADQVVAYGKVTDAVVVGDWDGNGTDTLAVRRGNTYYVKNTISGGTADRVQSFGRADDIVLSGDWNGDGTDTLGVRRLP